MEAGLSGARAEDVAGGALASVLAGVLVLLTAADGGFNPEVFLPVTLFLLALLVVLTLARPGLWRTLTRPTVVALGALAAFVLWCFASIVWADVEGEAWNGANRALLYLVVFAVFALWPWTPVAAAILFGAFALGTALVGVVSIELARRADDPLDAFIGPLFVEPIGYHNATAAVFALAFWPALVLALRRELHPLLRGAALAVSGVLLSLAVVPQSRGALLVFPIALALTVVLVPDRARWVLALVATLGTTLLVLDPLLDLYSSADRGDAEAGLERVSAALALQAGILLVVGVAAAYVDRRVSLAPRTARIGRATVVSAAALAVLVAAAVALPDDPVDRASARWEEFKAGETPDEGSTHFTSGLGSNRYDFWRVGLDVFREQPIHGAGVDNFAVAYLGDRRSDEEPRYPHSLEVQMLSQVGLIGSALLAVFLGAAAAAALAARRGPPAAAALAATAVAASIYWVGHASGDWLWEMPAVTAPAVGLLGLAAGLTRRPRPSSRNVRLLVVGGLAVVVAAVSLVPPWLAAKEIRAATSEWREDPDAAYARLERARALDPLSDRPDQLLGAIAGRRDDWTTMRAAYERAVERNPHSWYSHFQLAVVAAVEERRSEALGHLERAGALSPTEPAVGELRLQIERGERVDPDAIDRSFVRRLEERTG